MNTSESSEDCDVFSDIDYLEFTKNTNVDAVSYRSLVNNIRDALSAGIPKEIEKSSFSGFFFELLNNCLFCLDQSLETVTNILKDETNTNALVEYLDDAVSLLQMLSDFNKNVMALSMDSHGPDLYEKFPENFPTTTGHILMTVFSHCSNSEKLYGDNLETFKAQLRDLFKNCHELQLTYLSILEKHDLMCNGTSFELKILIEALKINLKIGEIVQPLDVKTMADQWKSYTTLCEKYNYHLTDTNLFQHCTKILCRMTRKSISCATEKNQEEKVVLRSMKVANFTIKILVKLCNILKNLKKKDYSYIFDLIYDVYVHRDNGLYNVSNKSSQFIQLMNTNIIAPVDCLIKELIVDNRFHNTVLGFGSSDPKLTAVYILVHTSAMKSLLHSDEFVSKSLIIECALDTLCVQDYYLKIQGLYEHMLVHTAALATTLNAEDFNKLEKRMFKCLLGKKWDDAMFSANLWVLLARYTSPQLVFNQLIWLCSMYKKLPSNRMFNRSPQKVHLGCTLRKLFEILDDDDKMKICKQFRVNDDDNLPLWVAIGINNLPDELKNVAEDGVFDKLKAQFAELNNDKSRNAVDTLINLLNLSATCTYTNIPRILNTIVQAWLRICPNQQPLPLDATWFYDYVGALASVIEAILDKVRVDGASVVKVLHIVTNLIGKGDTELKLTLTKLLCKLVAYDISEYRDKVNSDSCSAFSNMLLTSEIIIRNNLITTLTEYRNVRHFHDIFSKMNGEIQEIWSKIQSGEHYSELINDSNSNFTMEYNHTCLEKRKLFRPISQNSRNSIQKINSSQNSNNSVQEIQETRKTNSNNFYFDVEMVLDNESEEPMCKKVKLDEIEIIVSRLENDVSQLGNVKENVFTSEYKTRIRNICDKLRNLIK